MVHFPYRYEKSYMHRDVVTHVAVSAADFFITGSADGISNLKFLSFCVCAILLQSKYYLCCIRIYDPCIVKLFYCELVGNTRA